MNLTLSRHIPYSIPVLKSYLVYMCILCADFGYTNLKEIGMLSLSYQPTTPIRTHLLTNCLFHVTMSDPVTQVGYARKTFLHSKHT